MQHGYYRRSRLLSPRLFRFVVDKSTSRWLFCLNSGFSFNFYGLLGQLPCTCCIYSFKNMGPIHLLLQILRFMHFKILYCDS